MGQGMKKCLVLNGGTPTIDIHLHKLNFIVDLSVYNVHRDKPHFFLSTSTSCAQSMPLENASSEKVLNNTGDLKGVEECCTNRGFCFRKHILILKTLQGDFQGWNPN